MFSFFVYSHEGRVTVMVTITLLCYMHACVCYYSLFFALHYRNHW